MAIIYCRISRDREGAGLGIERQREDCEALARRLKYRVIDVYADNDMSAYSGKPRAGYRQLLADLREGRATEVLAWHTDRLHRSPVELEEYIDVCEPRGITTHTVKTGPIDLATPSGRMVARMLGAAARFESDHKSDRSKRAKQQKAEAGLWKGGRRPFGYESDGVTLRNDEAGEILKAAALLLSGVSLAGVTRDLNNRGVLTSTGSTWTPRNVTQVLKRPRNAGIMEHQGEEIGAAEWKPIFQREDGTADETTWRAVCALLNDPERRTTPGPARRWLGSGIYRCGPCVEAEAERVHMICATTGWGKRGPDDRKTIPTYKCATSRRHVARNAAHLDKFVTMLAIEWLARPGFVEAFSVPRDKAAAQARAIERGTLRAQEAEAGEMFAAREMTRAQLATTNKAIAERRAELDEAEAASARVTALTPFLRAAEAMAGWESLDLDRRRAVVAAVWESLDLDRHRAVITAIMRVTVLPAGRGRPAGWTPEYGAEWGYFDPNSIKIDEAS